jgi:transposase
MLQLEEFMEIQKLYHDGVSITEIARRLARDRKTVRKYLRQAPQPYQRPPRKWKIDAYRAYLRERWEQGVINASRLFRELQKRGYSGGYTQVKTTVREWRREGQERAFVRFETAPGEQSQLDWGHFGNWAGARLYAFVLLLCFSRMRYVEFTRRQDTETLLNCLVHAFHYFGGVTASVLTDNMKTVVVERVECQPQWNPRFLDFAAYYGFVPRVCHPYRPETKGKVEATIRYVRTSFWPGVKFESLTDLNRQALDWCEEVNGRVHATTRAVPKQRWPQEHLLSIEGRPDYDTSYVSHRQVMKDCLISYNGNRYSVPYVYVGKTVTVRETLDSGLLRIFHQQNRLAEHKLATGKGAMVMEAAHYGSLPRKPHAPAVTTNELVRELVPGPGVGLHHAVPEVELRSLTTYEEVAHVAAI